MDRNLCNNYNNYNNKLNYEILDLRLYIQNFVFSNWNNVNFRTNTEDIVIDLDLDLDEDQYINDDEIFYKGILYT
jgi:hypothetical protein